MLLLIEQNCFPSASHMPCLKIVYTLYGTSSKWTLVGVDGGEERKFSRIAGIIPFGIITDSMLTRCWKAAWTRWNSFVLLVYAKFLNSSVPTSPFSYAKAEASIMKLEQGMWSFLSQRQFPALAKQILLQRCRCVCIYPMGSACYLQCYLNFCQS